MDLEIQMFSENLILFFCAPGEETGGGDEFYEA